MESQVHTKFLLRDDQPFKIKEGKRSVALPPPMDLRKTFATGRNKSQLRLKTESLGIGDYVILENEKPQEISDRDFFTMISGMVNRVREVFETRQYQCYRAADKSIVIMRIEDKPSEA